MTPPDRKVETELEQPAAHDDPGSLCPLCETPASEPWCVRGGAAWWKCTRCSFLFVHPQPTDEKLRAMYRSVYYAESANYSGKKLAYWRNRVMAIEAVCGRGRALDIGCGQGQFLLAALGRGWDAWGTEVSHRAVAMVPEELRNRIVVAELPALPLSERWFDAVTYFDVIEHVRHPLAFLKAGRRYLRSGGSLIITTPDAGSLKARLKGKRWKYLDFRRYLHLYHFRAETLDRALRQAGFVVDRWLRRRGTPLFVVARKP